MVPELTVADFGKSLDFYVKIIGFKIINQRKNPNFAYLDLNDAQLMIEEYHSLGWNIGTLEKPYGRGINFQIEVDDVKKIERSLKEAGIDLYRERSESSYEVNGKKECQIELLVQDPDGYLLRFAEYSGTIT